jgi:hypothetical protein
MIRPSRIHSKGRVGAPACLVACLVSGCGSDQSTPNCSTEQAIVSGTEVPASVHLSEGQANAIVRLRLLSDTPDEFCSGVMLANDWVLSAGHCSIAVAAVVDFGPDADRESAGTDSVTTHPDLDLALWHLAKENGGPVLEREYLQAWTYAVDASWIGRDAELGGYGTTETGATGRRLFVSEKIVDVDDTFITVDGVGLSGACAGDSGGPLLVATHSGEPAVAGILSVGSADCRGIDRYVRVDRAWRWLASQIPDLQVSAGAPHAGCD